MNTTPSNEKGRKGLSPAVWWIGLAAGIFLVVLVIMLMIRDHARPGAPFGVALLAALILTPLGWALAGFIGWIQKPGRLMRFGFILVCFATLIALAYAVENMRGNRAWLNHRRQLAEQGVKFTMPELAPPTVPDNQNFALTPLLAPIFKFHHGRQGVVWEDTNGMARLKAIAVEERSEGARAQKLVLGRVETGTYADLEQWRDFYHGNTNYPQASDSTSAAGEVLTALSGYDDEVGELRQAAAARPQARFPIGYDEQPSSSILLPHLAQVKLLSRLMHLRATANLEAGQAKEAYQDLIVGLRLSDSIGREPLVIDHLVRIATLSFALQTVREGLARTAWDADQLASVQRTLGSVQILQEYRMALQGERALDVDMVEWLRVNPRQRYLAFDMSGEKPVSEVEGAALFMIPSGWFQQNKLTLSRFFEQYGLQVINPEAMRAYPDRATAESKAIAELRPGPYTLFTRAFVPALGRAGMKSAITHTHICEAVTACAIERFRAERGKLPGSLTELVPKYLERVPLDVIDGQPLRYQVAQGGAYSIYSIGWNARDDGGQVSLKGKVKRVNDLRSEAGSESADWEQGDWVWSIDPARRNKG